MPGSKTNFFETLLLQHIFQNANIPDGIAGTDPIMLGGSVGNLQIALFTSDPTEGSLGAEANYTGYARVNVARTAGNWNVYNVGDATSVHNVNAITFNQCQAGSPTNLVTHFAIFVTGTGTAYMIFHGQLNASLSISQGITPQFAATSITITED